MSDETIGSQEALFPLTNLNEQLLAFLRIANAMLEATDLDQILSAITREVSRVIDFDRSSVAFLSPDKESLVLRNIHKGADPDKIGEGRVIPIDESSVIGWVATHGKPMLRCSIEDSGDFDEVVEEESLKSDIIVPLTARGGLIGTLNVGSHNPNAFTDTDLEVMENCGKFASLAIEHTMLRLEAQELSRRYKTLQDNANDIIMIINKNTGKLVEVNRKCESVLGYSNEQLVGLSYFDLFAREDQYQARRDFINILSQKSLGFVDRRMINRDGNVIYVDINANLIKVKEDLFIQMIVHNVSQRRMLEQQIIHKNQNLQEVNRKLRQVDRMKTEFLANISHELRTPLSIIIAYSDSLRDPGLPEEERLKFVEVVAENSSNLLKLINNLLDLSKLEISGQMLSMSLSHIHDVIKSIWPQMERLAAEKGIVLSFEPLGDIPVIYIDNNQIVRVIHCLVQNAIKFTDRGGCVKLCTTRRAKEVWVQITDTGVGIHADELDDVFETFHQVDGSSSRKKGGMGIGLALARHIVELHKGRLWVESELGIGSTFTVSLPLDTEEVFLKGGTATHTPT
ncbi:MAG: ATP-binding protein [Candidatus Krumholzibacteria bacterium]|nr:ATP-binding protein [Candidatus Krumholzibacteria bacterium]